MPYVDSQGVNIYYEVVGTGPPLLLHHGATGSGQNWQANGFVDALKDAFRLILIDARGHGKSDKPHELTAYGNVNMARDVVALLDHLGIERAHFWGYSMGGLVGYRLASDYAHRLHRLIVGGAPSYIERGTVRFKASMERYERGIEQGMDVFIAETIARVGELPPDAIERLRALDLAAMAASYCHVYENGLDFRDDLPRMTLPILWYVGGADESVLATIRPFDGQLPNASLVVLPGLDHGGASRASTIIMPHVREFLA